MTKKELINSLELKDTVSFSLFRNGNIFEGYITNVNGRKMIKSFHLGNVSPKDVCNLKLVKKFINND